MLPNYREYRNWGHYEIIHTSPYCTIKIVTVSAGQRLSLQTHSLRDEHWTPIGAGLMATIDGKEIEMEPGFTYTINRSIEHRLENVTDRFVRLVEVILGSYSEDDIVRIDDDYGRV